MKPEPIVVAKGMRMEIDGQDILIVLTPMPPIKEEFGPQLTEQLNSLRKQVVFVPAVATHDGKVRLFCEAPLKEKLDAKKILVSHLTPLPIYADNSSQRF